jgi:hypothetical protein
MIYLLLLLCLIKCLFVVLLLAVANYLMLVVTIVLSYGLYLFQMLHLDHPMLVARLLAPCSDDLDTCPMLLQLY